MKPGSFDIDTAKELVGDERMRPIEAKARTDADAGRFDPPASIAKTYWGGVQDETARRVYISAHHKRMERAQRMAERQQLQPA